MNHLIKKFKVAGAGGSKPKPQPATLKPPKLGVHQLATSYSYAEILDLISDGPIAGLVNQNNSRVNGLAALQGIYMDNIPVAVTNDEAAQSLGQLPTNAISEISDVAGDIAGLGNSIKQTTVPSLAYGTNYSEGYRVHTRYHFYNRVNKYISLSGYSADPSTPNELDYVLDTRGAKAFKLLIHGSYLADTVDATMKLITSNTGYTQYRKGAYLSEAQDFLSSYTRQYADSLVVDRAEETTLRDYFENKIKSFVSSFNAGAALFVNANQIRFNSSSNTQFFIDENGEVNTDFVLNTHAPSGFDIFDTINFAYPTLDENGDWDGKMKGFIIYLLRGKGKNDVDRTRRAGRPLPYSFRTANYIEKTDVQSISNIVDFVISVKTKSNSKNSSKYNYTNILSEIKKGKEDQTPFRYFNNVYIDKTYDARLLGPFRASGEIQKLTPNANVLSNNFTLNSGGQKGLSANEGSTDSRSSGNFSDWDKNTISFDEEAVSSTHFVENPNTESVIVSLGVDALHDTAHRDISASEKIDAGSRFPGVVNIEIEIGKVNEKGVTTSHYKKRYQIIALVESPMVIDIGNPDAKNFESTAYKFIKDIDKDSIESGVFEPLELPSAFDVSGPEETPVRRYVKVTKLSTESNSILIKKFVKLNKVTEIIPVNCSYPFSSIIGTKLDARTFANIPTRTFDARLKLIQIPSNYFPVKDNVLETDKRYYTSVVDYENATTEDKSVYIGDWDGTFKEGWTDNPAWVLYDLLTNDRYGLGQYIDEDDINKWDLYKIGRFCDSVDEDGNFVGVPDGRGGLEPRYSCNILFSEGTKVFDSINQIANLFRGSVFYNNNEINFLDDRLREPTALFSNSNVKDGIFSYTNYRRDEQFNAIEVIYIDRFDNFKSKVEYVEDEEDITQRGIFKKQVNAYGVTSRAMANRVARHLIYQTIKENQSVSFVGGNEVLLCKPGDLIIVEDELKSLKSNFGRVLDVDDSAKTVRINEPFIIGEYTSGITLYSPTGQSTSEDIDAIATGVRERLTGFSITGNAGGALDDFTGIYKFSGYTDGFNGRSEEELNEQYALYTGSRTPQNIIYYSTLATGWVFSTGSAFENDNEYDKIIGVTGGKSILSLSTGGFNGYDSADSDYRTAGSSGFSGDFDNSNGDLSRTTQGALESDISLVTTPQIITLSITGAVNQDYGSLLYVDSGDINANLLSFVSDGSAYRIQRQNSDDQIYKILEMREEAPNEYSVVATKYDSGKFDLIENSVSIEYQSETFSYDKSDLQINEVNYVTLDNPVIDSVTTGDGSQQGFYISGNWQSVSNATGYNVILGTPAGDEISENTTETGLAFDNNELIGNYTYSVKALGNNSKKAGVRYYNSLDSVSGISILPTSSDLYETDNAVISKIKIQ